MINNDPIFSTLDAQIFGQMLTKLKLEERADKKLLQQEKEYVDDPSDMDWLITGWLNRCENYGCNDRHILAVELHSILLDHGFKIVKQ